MNKHDTLPCLFCDKLLKPIFKQDGWKYLQPNDGGEVEFKFAYGSRFDQYIGMTKFQALICDDCAEKYINKMQKIGYDWDMNIVFDSNKEKEKDGA